MDRFVKLDDLPYGTDSLSGPAYRALARAQQAGLAAARQLHDVDWEDAHAELKGWWANRVPWHVTVFGVLFLALELARRARKFTKRRTLYRAHLKSF